MMLLFRTKTTQTALAHKMGVTQAALSRKLHGERKWTLDDLYTAASALGVSVLDILGETLPDSPKPQPRD